MRIASRKTGIYPAIPIMARMLAILMDKWQKRSPVCTYGAIIVPILQNFNPNDVHHIVNHSESVFLFTSDNIWESLEEEKLSGLRAIFSLTDFRYLHQRDGETV